MNNDELRIQLLGPHLAKVDPMLPVLVWDAYHGDDEAMLQLAELLDRCGRPKLAERVREILHHAGVRQ